jgi:hypothetical protein
LAAPTELDRQSARAAFAEGEEAFAAHDYDAALQRFRHALELRPHDAVRFNIAVCLERLARFRAAIAEYELALASRDVDEHARTRAREQVVRLRGLLASLVVSEPRGAVLLVDGETICPALPCRTEVDPRPLVITVRARDGREGTKRVEPVRGAEIEVSVPLPSVPFTNAGAREPGPRARPTRFPTWGGWVGVVGVGVGAASTLGFGLRASALHDAYVRAPTEDSREDGIFARTLANVSVGVTALFAAVVLIDVLIHPPGR